MSVAEKKLSLIEWLAGIEDKKVLKEVDRIRLKSGSRNENVPLKKLTLEEFYERIEKSEDAARNGKVISQKDIEKEAESW